MQCTPSPDLYLLNLQSIRNIMEIRITIFLNNGDKEKLIGTRTLYYPMNMFNTGRCFLLDFEVDYLSKSFQVEARKSSFISVL